MATKIWAHDRDQHLPDNGDLGVLLEAAHHCWLVGSSEWPLELPLAHTDKQRSGREYLWALGRPSCPLCALLSEATRGASASPQVASFGLGRSSAQRRKRVSGRRLATAGSHQPVKSINGFRV